jgi:hypothetical protein
MVTTPKIALTCTKPPKCASDACNDAPVRFAFRVSKRVGIEIRVPKLATRLDGAFRVSSQTASWRCWTYPGQIDRASLSLVAPTREGVGQGHCVAALECDIGAADLYRSC